MPVRIVAVGATTFILLVALCFFRAALSTPLYAGRAGRTCDNCHVTPNKWENPALAERKCTLSCQGCHVDPAGGGMRTTSGRFYGRSTLPMIATGPRPTRDWDRNVPLLGRRDRATSYTDEIPYGPSNLAQSIAYNDSIHDFWGRGRPWGGDHKYAFYQGRYGRLNASPFFRIGWDIRVAALAAGTTLFFPMQGDLPVLLHPVRHLTLFVNTGLRGRTSGFGDPTDDDRKPYFREAFVMVHEAPFGTYVKAGRFVPSFGLRLDDHTSAIRRAFELDGALPKSRVSGAEIGAAPNYPFVQLSVFGVRTAGEMPSRYDIFDIGDGWGGALNAGFRELGWSIGASAMVKRRDLDKGGDLSAFGVYGVFNPWFYSPRVPLTYQLEIDGGTYQRMSGNGAHQAASYQELDWLWRNGVNFLIAHDWQDPDRDVKDDEWHRLQFGAQVTPYPGVTIDGRARALLPRAGGKDADLFVQLHLWH